MVGPEEGDDGFHPHQYRPTTVFLLVKNAAGIYEVGIVLKNIALQCSANRYKQKRFLTLNA